MCYMQKLKLRLKDKLHYRKSFVGSFEAMAQGVIGSKKIIEKVENERAGIPYVSEYGKYYWNVIFTGIRLPAFYNSTVSNCVSSLFFDLRNSIPYDKVGCLSSDDHEDCLIRCFSIDRQEYEIPTLNSFNQWCPKSYSVIASYLLENLKECNLEARIFIDSYVKHRNQLELALKDVNRVYPTTDEESIAIRNRFRKVIGLKEKCISDNDGLT